MPTKHKRITITVTECCDECTQRVIDYWKHLKTHEEAAKLSVIRHWPRDAYDGQKAGA